MIEEDSIFIVFVILFFVDIGKVEFSIEEYDFLKKILDFF